MNTYNAMAETVKELAQVLGILVIPITVLGFWRSRLLAQDAEKWKARQEEMNTYNDLNSKYSDFLALLLSNADVDIGEFGYPKKPITDERDILRRKYLYGILVCLFERAYLLYSAVERMEQDGAHGGRKKTFVVKMLEAIEKAIFGDTQGKYESSFYRNQWRGWVSYINFYCSIPEFQEFWSDRLDGNVDVNTTQWQDAEFEKFMGQRIQAHQIRGDNIGVELTFQDPVV